VPIHFANLILEKYHDFHAFKDHHEAFVYFTNRILPYVNASITKYERLKYQKTMSECFSYTDEAFALLMVVNYEARWMLQHEALMGYPHESRKTRDKMWKDALFTSSTEESRCGQSWTKEGMLKFNSLCEMVKSQQRKEETGSNVEKQLWAWCQKNDSMPPWWEEGEGVDAQDDLGQEEKEEEVETMGECDIYQV
jgi:hypothetical protein